MSFSPTIQASMRWSGSWMMARRTREAQDGDPAGALMRADAVLLSDIRPGAPPAPASAAGRVLLTGATGFLGAHLLKTLLTDTDAELLCLVRDRGSGDESWRRVRRSLARYRLWDDAFSGRIHTVSGDLSRPGLGLTAAGRAAIGRPSTPSTTPRPTSTGSPRTAPSAPPTSSRHGS